MQQYIPGLGSPENNKMSQEAFDQFQKVLDQDPKNTVAIASIASLNLNQKKWDEAEQWYEKLIAVEPNNADAYYSMGFIAWSKWYPVYGTARANLGMKQEDPGPLKDKKVKEELRQKWAPVIDAGMAALDKALQINPEYDDAMAYEYRPKDDLSQLEKAFRFASKYHEGQSRDSGEAYMAHPVMVAHILADMRMDVVAMQTGLLHDVVEDTSVTVDQVRKEFGDEVAR